jgi:DnaK suppressor protein
MIAVDDRSVGDSIDAALDCEQDELDSQLAWFESRELAAIDDALERIAEGRYGVCESCEKPIPAARLEAVPYVTLCIKCQRSSERTGAGHTAAFHWDRISDELLEDERDRDFELEFELA